MVSLQRYRPAEGDKNTCRFHAYKDNPPDALGEQGPDVRSFRGRAIFEKDHGP